jgi:hypothetical protein
MGFPAHMAGLGGTNQHVWSAVRGEHAIRANECWPCMSHLAATKPWPLQPPTLYHGTAV